MPLIAGVFIGMVLLGLWPVLKWLLWLFLAWLAYLYRKAELPETAQDDSEN